MITGDVNKVIDTASARLFTHVSHLMKELETRREEKALTATLQRQAVELKDQLAASQDRISALERSMPRINELEDIVRKSETIITNLETALKAREDGLAELRLQMEKTKIDLETNRRRLGEAVNDLSIRNRLVDKLSRDLTEKELSLAKSLAVIRRLEEDLNRLCPAIEQLAAAEAPQEPTAELQVLSGEVKPEALIVQKAARPPAVTRDEPPPPPPPQEALPDSPAAQNALIEKFKKLISRYDH
jgi:DNA repair exonuclease SbcCD ATPase subunit